MKGVWEDVAWSREGHKSLLQLCGQGSSFSPSLHRGFAILANPQKHFLCWRTAPALGLVRAAELLLCLLVIYVPPLLFMIWYLEVPAGLTVQVTSPRDCPGSPRHQPSSPQAHWQGWNLYKAFYDAVCTEVSFCELKISLVSSPRPLQSHFSSAASLGFALYGTLWCAGLGTHPMSTCSSPTALSILGKSSSSISSTHVGFFGLWSMHSFPGAVRDWERWRNEGADECLLNEEAYWHQARVLAF